MKFGEQLKHERNKLNLTQEAVAIDLFVSRQTISSWETGRTYPDIDSLIALSNLYQISLDRLLKEDNGMVEDIRRKTELKESKVVLGASGVVNLLLFLVVMLNLLEVKGFKIERNTSLLIMFIMLGNLFITVYAKNKYLQYSIKKPTNFQQMVKKGLLPGAVVLGGCLLVISRVSAIVPKEEASHVLGLGTGVVAGGVLAWCIIKLMDRYIQK